MNKLATAYNYPTPSFSIFDGEGNSESIELPSNLAGRNNPSDFITWRFGRICRTYVLGAFSSNMCWTEREAFVRTYIKPPSAPIVITATPVLNQIGIQAAAGPGLTGSVRVALRWLDTLHGRRSPLGGASAAIALVNQGLAFESAPAAPLPDDPYVDALEVWVSVDGGLFRHWSTIDIDVPDFEVHDTATGEAYSTTLIAWPLLGFGDIAGGRLFAAGDQTNPQRIHISEAALPDDYAGISIDTPFGEPVIAIKNIGGTIFVQCPASSYYIQIFGGSDFVMRPLKPRVGGYGQPTIVLFDTTAWIPTQRGWFECDGTSMRPMGEGVWSNTWRQTVTETNKRAPYQQGFAVADLVTGVVKFKGRPALPEVPSEISYPSIIGYPTDAVNDYWVVKFDGELSFDQANGSGHTCAAMLFEPDAVIGDLHTGDLDGNILLENQVRKADKTTVATVETAVPIRFLWHSHHHKIGPVLNDKDSYKTTDVGIFVRNENLDGELGVYCGNEYAWQSGEAGSPNFAAPETFEVDAGIESPSSGAQQNSFVPRDRFTVQGVQRGAGTCVSVRFTAELEADDPGEGNGAIEQYEEIALSGWGFIASDGTESRPIAPWIDPSP